MHNGKVSYLDWLLLLWLKTQTAPTELNCYRRCYTPHGHSDSAVNRLSAFTDLARFKKN